MTEQNDNIKLALTIAGGLIVISTIKAAGKAIVNTFTPGSAVPDNLQQYLTDIYTDHVELIKNLNINQKNLRFGRQVYKELALRQYNDMNGVNIGNFDDVYEPLKDLNNDELKTVFMDFGLRAPTIAFGNIAIGDRRNLLAWYQSEFTGNNLKKLINLFSKTGLIKPI